MHLFFKLADYEVLAKCPAFLKPHSLGLTLHFPSACLIVYAVQLPDDPAGISYGYAAGRYGARSRVDLHVGCYHHPVPDINPVVVHEGAVHIDDDAVAQEDILPVLAMEIDVHMDSLADTAKHLAQQTEPACGVSIIGSIEFCQQAFCPYGHCRQLRVAADERLSRHAFLIFSHHR